MPSTYTRKDGTAVRYETKEYNDAYRAAHSEQPVHCKACDKQVSALNLARHIRSAYHQKREEVVAAEPEVPEPIPEPVKEPEPVVMEVKDSRPKIYTMTVKEMKAKAKELNLKGYSKLTKPELEQLITKGNIGTPVEVTKEEVKESAPAPAAAVKEPAATKTKATSPWNAFLSEYRKENNVSLKEAMKQKSAYVTWKGKPAA
jgi:hypothetical protein